jgi:hypothetical protein
MSAKKKTVAQQREHVAEKHPEIALVPPLDDAAEQHGKATDLTCGATMQRLGHRYACAQPARHGGDHSSAGGQRWRPRSADDIGEPGSEPTA